MTKEYKNKLIKLASYVSVATALMIMSAKTYGWLATESQSILASLIDSMLDISSSLINLIALRVSLTPPDDNHRFGHEKFQDLAIFSQGIFFVASSLFILSASLKSLWEGNVVTNNDIGLESMYLCVFLTTILIGFQSYVIRKTKSRMIVADKLHYFSDLLTNIGVIISIYWSSSFWYLDSLAGMLIAIYIMYASYKILRESIRNLVDEELPFEDKEKILLIVSKFPDVSGIHELKTRYAAHKPFIQFHLELDGNLTLYRAHDVSDNIMMALFREFPDAEITIHQDPANHEKNVKYRERIRK